MRKKADPLAWGPSPLLFRLAVPGLRDALYARLVGDRHPPQRSRVHLHPELAGSL